MKTAKRTKRRMGRPSKEEGFRTTGQFSVDLPSDIQARLNAEAEAKMTSRASIVRVAILKYLEAVTA